MTIVRVGTNQKYSTGWESVFGKGKKKSASEPAAKKHAVGTTKAAPTKPSKPAGAKVAAKSAKKKASTKKGKSK